MNCICLVETPPPPAHTEPRCIRPTPPTIPSTDILRLHLLAKQQQQQNVIVLKEPQTDVKLLTTLVSILVYSLDLCSNCQHRNARFKHVTDQVRGRGLLLPAGKVPRLSKCKSFPLLKKRRTARYTGLGSRHTAVEKTRPKRRHYVIKCGGESGSSREFSGGVLQSSSNSGEQQKEMPAADDSDVTIAAASPAELDIIAALSNIATPLSAERAAMERELFDDTSAVDQLISPPNIQHTGTELKRERSYVIDTSSIMRLDNKDKDDSELYELPDLSSLPSLNHQQHEDDFSQSAAGFPDELLMNIGTGCPYDVNSQLPHSNDTPGQQPVLSYDPSLPTTSTSRQIKLEPFNYSYFSSSQTPSINSFDGNIQLESDSNNTRGETSNLLARHADSASEHSTIFSSFGPVLVGNSASPSVVSADDRTGPTQTEEWFRNILNDG